MLDNLKSLINYKSIDKDISDKNYEVALDKLNELISAGYHPAETILKRGKLCRKLLMLEEAYSDFTYIITHCSKKTLAYIERASLNFETSNFTEAINDCNFILNSTPNNIEIKRIKFLSLAFGSDIEYSKEYILSVLNYEKYDIVKYILTEIEYYISSNELAKSLRLTQVINLIDKDNPLTMEKIANIQEKAGNKEEANNIRMNFDSLFTKYFISHFRFTDMYQEKDYKEICFLLDLKIFDKTNLFVYPMTILEGYKNYIEGHIIDSKECFEKVIKINPQKPEGYILLAQTYQLMASYDNPEYRNEAKINYENALQIYEKEKLDNKAEEMRRQLNHIKSGSKIYS